MKNTSFRARALACALLSTTAMCGLMASPASAQTATTPDRQVLDENGVDVASGQFKTAAESVDIAGLGFGLGWTGNLVHDSFDVRIVRFGTTQRRVSIAGRTRLYTGSSGTFAPQDADGSTLVETSTGNFTLTHADGTQYMFKPSGRITNGLTVPVSIIDKIVQTDGRTLTFNYRTATFQQCGLPGNPPSPPCSSNARTRLQSLTDNQGHMLKPVYASQQVFITADNMEDTGFGEIVSVTAIDLSTDYCNPTADTCTALTQTWPKLEVSETPGSGGSTIETVKDEGGNETDVTRDPNDRVTGVDLPANAGNDRAVTYDSNGRVSTLTEGGRSWTYTYVDTSTTLTTTASLSGGGSRVTVVDKASNRLLSETDELNRTTSYQYDSNGRRTRITYPEGNYTQFTYSVRGNVTETRHVAKSGSGLADIVTSASFDIICTVPAKCNKPNSVTDARGNTTDFTYSNVHGGVTRMQLPAPTPGAPRPEVNYTYTALYGRKKNSSGTLVTETVPVYLVTQITSCATAATCSGTANETVVTTTYDQNNLLPATVTTAAGDGSISAAVTTAYDAFDRPLTVDGPLSGSADTTRYYYDGTGRLRGEIGPDPDGASALLHRALRYSYDAEDRVTKVERGTSTSQADGAIESITVLETVDSAYDANGRKLRDSLSAGGTTYALTQTSYDSLGRLQCVAQRMNPAEFASLPSDACTLDTTGSFGPDRITKTSYDNADQVTLVQTGYGVSGVQADDVTATYRSNGQLETLTDAEGNKTTYEYDGHDRLAKTRMPSPTTDGVSSTTDYEQPGYDANGNVTSFRNRANETISVTFDALNRPTFKDLPGSEPDVTYIYDLLGRLTGASQTGHALSFTYDALGRNLTQVGPHGTVTSTWDVAGRRTRITHPDTFYVDQDYLVTGEMTKIRENGATSGIGVLATFAYDDLGRRTSLTRGNGTVTSYGFDNASRLTSLTQDVNGTASDLTLSFSYNNAFQTVSNLRSNDAYAWNGHGSGTTSSSVNGLNQLTATGGASVTHDARGNRTADATRTYTYSSENLLTAATFPPAFGQSSISYVYDPLMRLYQTSPSSPTRLGYDGLDLLTEYTLSNQQYRRYVHGPGMDEPIVMFMMNPTNGTFTRWWYHADERGSVVLLSDGAGNANTINRYDEYGKPAATNWGKFGYTGQTWHGEIGAYNYKNRIYSADTGRFLQADPIGYEAGMNLYAYVRHDPINFVDPLGLNGCGLSDEEEPTVCGGMSRSEIERIMAQLSGLLDRKISDFGKENWCAAAKQVGRITAWGGGLGVNFDSKIEKFALSEFYNGRTSPLRLSPNILPMITNFTGSGNKNVSRIYVPDSKSYDPPGSFRREVHFGNANSGQVPQIEALLGRATVIFDSGGNAIGLEDHFDFNARSDTDFLTKAGMDSIKADAKEFCGSSAIGFSVSAGVGR